MNATPLPVSDTWLERYRLAALRRARPAGMGTHHRRRRGQSLEFHEYMEYQPGDDFRRIDWVASARRGGSPQTGGKHLLVRHFAAEEHLQVVISIDTSDTLNLPDGLKYQVPWMPKLQQALWIAEALTRVVLRDGDVVVLHNLFSRGAAPVRLSGSEKMASPFSVLKKFAAVNLEKPSGNLTCLDRYLPPAVVWVILSDFYFSRELAALLASRIREAMSGYRDVLTVDLDNWPCERQMVRDRDILLRGPGLTDSLEPRYHLDEARLDQVEAKIEKEKGAFFSAINLPKNCRSHWRWPELPSVENPDADAVNFFRTQFQRDNVIASIFSPKI